VHTVPFRLGKRPGANRELHAPFRGSPGGQSPRATRLTADARRRGDDGALSEGERAELGRLRQENGELSAEHTARASERTVRITFGWTRSALRDPARMPSLYRAFIRLPPGVEALHDLPGIRRLTRAGLLLRLSDGWLYPAPDRFSGWA